MKKLFTLCCYALFGAAMAHAQLQVTCNGKEVAEGEVLTFYAHEDDFGDMVAGPAMDPTFKNTTDAAYDLTVKVTTSENAKNKCLNWCGITQMCQFIMGGSETRTAKLNPGGFGLPMQLHAKFEEGEFKTYEATVMVYKGSEYLTSFKEIFIYDGEDHTGIENAEAGHRVNFTNNALTYSFNTVAPRSLQVYAADGRLVRSAALSSAKGSLNLNGLPQGVYVYNLTENGKTVKSQKVVLAGK